MGMSISEIQARQQEDRGYSTTRSEFAYQQALKIKEMDKAQETIQTSNDSTIPATNASSDQKTTDALYEQLNDKNYTLTGDDIDLSKLAGTASDASNGNFINKDKIYTPSFEGELTYQVRDDGTVKIMSKDGVPLAFAPIDAFKLKEKQNSQTLDNYAYQQQSHQTKERSQVSNPYEEAPKVQTQAAQPETTYTAAQNNNNNTPSFFEEPMPIYESYKAKQNSQFTFPTLEELKQMNSQQQQTPPDLSFILNNENSNVKWASNSDGSFSKIIVENPYVDNK